MKNTNTAVKNNLRVIEGDNSRQSANNNRELPKLPIMKTIKEMVALREDRIPIFVTCVFRMKLFIPKPGRNISSTMKSMWII